MYLNKHVVGEIFGDCWSISFVSARRDAFPKNYNNTYERLERSHKPVTLKKYIIFLDPRYL